MKIRSCIALLLMLVICLTACKSSVPEVTPADTEPVNDNTAEPSAVPTEAALPLELDFDACAEEIVSLIPGEEETEVHYPGEDILDRPPMNYYPTEDKIYIVNFDPDIERDYDTILCVDTSDGGIDLLQPEKYNAAASLYNIHANPFVIHKDTLIMHNKAYDIKNDRMYDASSPIPDEREYASQQVMYVIGDDVFLSYDITEINADYNTRMVCRFDWENMKWGEPKQLFNTDGKEYYSVGFIGIDAEGNKYFAMPDPEAEKENRYRNAIEKFDVNDKLVSRVLLPWYDDGRDGVFWDMGGSSFRVTEDGTVYILLPFVESLKVYKVNMG